MVAGQAGPSDTVPAYRATTRAAARSPVQGTSVKRVVPKELHSSTPRNTAPNPDERADDAAEAGAPPPDPPAPDHCRHPLSTAVATNTATAVIAAIATAAPREADRTRRRRPPPPPPRTTMNPSPRRTPDAPRRPA
ncbi:hypothetical protein GCM10010344_45940 [Streptomyces bluensis]|nr:hypothetical protein GCM10010344_45940 [Streptomyces bluensis]